MVICAVASVCAAHESLDLSKVAPSERFPVALQYVIRAARHDFHTLKGAKIELYGDVQRVWYEAHPVLPGASDCIILYNDDVYRCEWKARTPAALDRTWRELATATEKVLQAPWIPRDATPVAKTYELPTERTLPTVQLELRMERKRGVITLSVAPVRGR